VKVTTPAGTATSAANFYAPPIINGFTPSHGVVGTIVTLTGTNFLGASAVQFNGLNATSFTVVNNGSIQVSVPSGAQTGPIKVIAPAGSYTTVTDFVLDYRSDLAVTITDAPDRSRREQSRVHDLRPEQRGRTPAPSCVFNQLPAVLSDAQVCLYGPGRLRHERKHPHCEPGTIPSVSVASVTLTVTPTNIGTIYDSANAVSGYIDPVSSNNFGSAVTIVEPLPLLSISRASNNQVRVSWAAGLSNYSLQYKNALPTNNAWLSNSAVPVLTNNQNVITEPATNTRRFYRLIR